MYKEKFEKKEVEIIFDLKIKISLLVTIFFVVLGQFLIFILFFFSLTKLHVPVQYLPSPDTTNPGGHWHEKLPS